MKIILKLLSLAALGLTVIPAFLVAQGALSWNTHAGLMLAGATLWFATAPFWMKIKE